MNPVATTPFKAGHHEPMADQPGPPPFSSDAVRSMIVGLDREAPLLGGGARPYVNLDNAATTPPWRAVVDKVNAFIPWYSSVHRGTGFKSLLSTQVYDQCHEAVARFVGADPQYHTVIFCCNTTLAINKVARLLRLAPGEKVLTTILEHHSNILPWRKAGPVAYVGLRDERGALDLDDLAQKLCEAAGRVRLVAVSGASNITGHLPPLRAIARLAHQHGAWLLVDAAQLAAHLPIRMGGAEDPERIDFLAFSGHKLYAPYGTGVLVGPRRFFEAAAPNTVGGGTVKLVTLEDVEWADLPEREEAGSPNVVGALALAESIRILEQLDREALARNERELTAHLLDRLAGLSGLRVYGDPDPAGVGDRLGVVPILAEALTHAELAAALGYEWGIGVRHGCFCANPYTQRLLGIDDEGIREHLRQVRAGDLSRLPGLVRISLGLYNTRAEIDYLCEALESILRHGPRGRYRLDKATGQVFPEDAPRPPERFFSLSD